jgi:hypothetical protein
MLDEMTEINRETVLGILVINLNKKRVYALFVPHLLTPDETHQHAALSVKFIEMIDDGNILKRIIMGNEL